MLAGGKGRGEKGVAFGGVGDTGREVGSGGNGSSERCDSLVLSDGLRQAEQASALGREEIPAPSASAARASDSRPPTPLERPPNRPRPEPAFSPFLQTLCNIYKKSISSW